MKLHHHPPSGHAHRAHLFLSLAAIPHALVEVDLAEGAHRSGALPGFVPFQQTPVGLRA